MKYLKEFWFYWKTLWVNPWWYVIVVPMFLFGNDIYGAISGTAIAMVVLPIFVMIVRRVGLENAGLGKDKKK